jgi:S1-C subfamily serine protease
MLVTIRRRYVMVAVLLVVGLLLVGSGCSNKPTPNTMPSLHYGNGESLVQSIPADFGPVVDKIAPAVVRIVTKTTTYNWFFQPIPQEGVGTGVIYDSAGYVLTNRHVVEGAEKITVYSSSRKSYEAKKVWESSDTDLAVVKIEGSAFPVAGFCPEKDVAAYEWVIAIGYPFDIGGSPTVSEGIISALGRSIQEQDGTTLKAVIQTTAAINPGNSGGPLVDLSGRVVGINTAVLSSAENIGFAIGVSEIDRYVGSLSPS